MSAVYVHGTAPLSRIQATATEVSRPPEKAMPTRSPVGREVRTLDMRQEYALHRMIMQNLDRPARGLAARDAFLDRTATRRYGELLGRPRRLDHDVAGLGVGREGAPGAERGSYAPVEAMPPWSTRAQARQPNAAVDVTARMRFQRFHVASKASRTAARSAMPSGCPAAASWSLSGTLTAAVMANISP